MLASARDRQVVVWPARGRHVVGTAVPSVPVRMGRTVALLSMWLLASIDATADACPFDWRGPDVAVAVKPCGMGGAPVAPDATAIAAAYGAFGVGVPCWPKRRACISSSAPPHVMRLTITTTATRAIAVIN